MKTLTLVVLAAVLATAATGCNKRIREANGPGTAPPMAPAPVPS